MKKPSCGSVFFMSISLMRHLVRRNHILGAQQLVELLLRQQTLLEHQVIHTAVLLQGTLCNLRAVLISKYRVQGSHDTYAAKNKFLAVTFVGSDAIDAKYTQACKTTQQHANG